MEEEIEKRKSKLKEFFFGWVKDNYDKAFLLLLSAAAIIGLWFFFISKGQPLWYDSANFLSTAKKWALGLNNVNDIWYYRRGFLWVLISLVFFKTGIGEIGIQFIGVLFYLGLIIVSYFLLSKMFNKKTALIASFFMTFSWVFLFFIGRSMTDIPAAFFLMLSLLFFWKGFVLKEGNKFSYLSGLFFGIAALTRFQLMMFLLPVIVYLFLDKKFKLFKDKTFWITTGIFLLTISPHLIMYSLHYGNFFTDILRYYLGVGATEANISSAAATATFTNYFDYFKNMPYILTWPIFILFLVGACIFFSNLILGFDKILKDKDIQKRFFVLAWGLFTLIALGRITAGAVEQRYAIPTFTFLFFFAAIPIVALMDFLIKHLNFKKGTAIFLIIVGIIGAIIPGVIFAKNLTEAKSTSYLEVKEAALWIKENSNPEDVIISNSIPYITYYSERTCYPMNVNQTIFEENLSTLNPTMLMISVFEPHEQWMYEYPQLHNDTLQPIKVFYTSQQPTVVLYKFSKKD